MKSSKSKGKNNARHKKFKDQHPAAGPKLAGALVSLLEGGERTRAGHRRVRRDARRHERQGGFKTNAVRLRGG